MKQNRRVSFPQMRLENNRNFTNESPVSLAKVLISLKLGVIGTIKCPSAQAKLDCFVHFLRRKVDSVDVSKGSPPLSNQQFTSA